MVKSNVNSAFSNILCVLKKTLRFTFYVKKKQIAIVYTLTLYNIIYCNNEYEILLSNQCVYNNHLKFVTIESSTCWNPPSVMFIDGGESRTGGQLESRAGEYLWDKLNFKLILILKKGHAILNAIK